MANRISQHVKGQTVDATITPEQAIAALARHCRTFVFVGYGHDCKTQLKMVKASTDEGHKELDRMAEDTLDTIMESDDAIMDADMAAAGPMDDDESEGE